MFSPASVCLFVCLSVCSSVTKISEDPVCIIYKTNMYHPQTKGHYIIMYLLIIMFGDVSVTCIIKI